MLECQQAIGAANARGINAGLDRNLDGRFSARTNLGKEIRQIETRNEVIIAGHRDEYECYRDLPKLRWLQFRETFAREKAFLISLCAWAVSAILLIGGTYLTDSASGTHSEVGKSMLYGMTSVCALISLGVFFAYRSQAGQAAQRLTPVPPAVTMENVNTY